MYKKIPLDLVKIEANKTIRDAMYILNTREERFLLVVTKDRQLLGTITDGDIRRAMLKGIDINQKVRLCMNKNPIISNTPMKDLSFLFSKMNSTLKFLPIINKENKILSVLLEHSNQIERKALVMAGGFGKRLGNITKQNS